MTHGSSLKLGLHLLMVSHSCTYYGVNWEFYILINYTSHTMDSSSDHCTKHRVLSQFQRIMLFNNLTYGLLVTQKIIIWHAITLSNIIIQLIHSLLKRQHLYSIFRQGQSTLVICRTCKIQLKNIEFYTPGLWNRLWSLNAFTPQKLPTPFSGIMTMVSIMALQKFVVPMNIT